MQIQTILVRGYLVFGRELVDEMGLLSYLVEESFVVVCPRNTGELDPFQFIRQQLSITHLHHLRERQTVIQ